MKPFSKRMDRFGEGIFTTLLKKKQDKLAAGVHVVDLSVGTPNIPPAPHIRQAICDACADPANYIYAIRDTSRLLEAAAQWYKRRYGVELNPKTEIASLLGSQEGLAHICLSIANEGDVVLVPDPCYPVFGDGPAIAGAELHFMPMRRENGYVIDLRDIPSETAKKAKLMIVSYPNNPTTAMAPDSFYHDLISFARQNDIIVLHDNAYSELVFDGKIGGSFLRFEGAKEVGVEFNSLSKTYGLAGARVGFCVGNATVVENLTKLKSAMDYGMFLPVQEGAIAAITGDQSCVKTTCAAYENRRNLLAEGLCEIGWQVEKGAGTMFLWAPLPAGYTDSIAFAGLLLDKAGVMATPGAAFGPSGEGNLRFALVQDEAEIRRAIASIKASGLLNPNA